MNWKVEYWRRGEHPTLVGREEYPSRAAAGRVVAQRQSQNTVRDQMHRTYKVWVA